MPQVQLEDRIFETAKKRAAESGFASVEDYLADFVVHDGQFGESCEVPNLAYLFTPEVLAEIQKAEAEIDAGDFVTGDEVDEYFDRKRADRLKQSTAQ